MLRASAAPVREGEIVAAKYRVERVIGRGGMGVVVAATHIELGQRVALKFLVQGVDDGDAVERFRREARAAGNLKSDHVVRVFDIGRLPSREPFMVMELLEGADLAEVLESGPLTMSEAAGYVFQACDALAEAHSAGIVHRDLKPRNLFVTRTGTGQARLKVLDFGISKMSADRGERALTGRSDVMGTPDYMSPEQVRASHGVDGRTDIWALGVILYELVAQRVPFEGASLTHLCALILEAEPKPLRSVAPTVSEDFERLVARCLAKDPEKRFATVGELATALAAFLPTASRSPTVPVPGASHRPPKALPAKIEKTDGGTSVSWSGPEAPRRAGGPKIATKIAAVVVVFGLLAGIAGYSVTERASARGARPEASAAPPPPPATPAEPAPSDMPPPAPNDAPKALSAAPPVVPSATAVRLHRPRPAPSQSAAVDSTTFAPPDMRK
jgi:serine/threonine-protein kinase